MKIDIHAHILPKTWDSLKDKYGYEGFIQIQHQGNGVAHMMYDNGQFFRAVNENCWNPDAIIKDLDEHNVDMMVLCTVPVLFNYWAEPDHTYDWAIFLNNDIAEIQRRYPKRFLAMGTLPMQHIPYAIEEMRRCATELQLPGIQIGSNILGKNLDDKSLFPFYAAAEELGIGLFIHPWEMMGRDEIKKYWLPWLVGMPAETTRAICSMIFGGVFDAFPRLRVMFAHGGGAFPYTLGRIEHGYNCRPDLVNVNDVQPPSAYCGRFWVDSITHNPDALRYMLSVFPSDKVAYGTDYPFPLGDLEHGAMINSMTDLSEQIKEDIFCNATAEFLNIDVRYLHETGLRRPVQKEPVLG